MSKLTAIIPARAGSKRLPGKNTIDFNGKPMIEWTLIAAKEAKLFSRIIVSTDDDRVRTIASDYDVTIVPQPQYTQDNMASRKVVSHALSRFHGMSDFAVLLQPTSPLRTAEHIKAAWKVLNKTRFYSLVSVNPMGEVNGAIYIFSGECG